MKEHLFLSKSGSINFIIETLTNKKTFIMFREKMFIELIHFTTLAAKH